jgi:hypothetical protein
MITAMNTTMNAINMAKLGIGFGPKALASIGLLPHSAIKRIERIRATSFITRSVTGASKL